MLAPCGMKGKAVLVVDDDPLIRWALARELSALGVTVAYERSGGTALEEVRAAQYDLVLLDVHLPDANGIDLLGAIRRLSPGTRVIVMSADADEENRRRSIAAGALRFLEKPFDLSALHRAVRSALGVCADERRTRRHPCAIPVRIALVSPVPRAGELDFGDFVGIAREVGPRGIRIATVFPLEAGQAVRLRFGHAAPEDPLLALLPADGAAEVLWVIPTPDGFDAGLRYINPGRTS